MARRKAGCTALSHFAASPSRIQLNSTWLVKAFKRVFMIKTDRSLAANPFFRHSLGHATFYTDRHIFIHIAMDDIHAKCLVPHRNPKNMLYMLTSTFEQSSILYIFAIASSFSWDKSSFKKGMQIFSFWDSNKKIKGKSHFFYLWIRQTYLYQCQ